MQLPAQTLPQYLAQEQTSAVNLTQQSIAK